MARFIPGIALPPYTNQQVDPLADLTRLLSRLQQTILRADAEREARLRNNEFEREKAQANISYARTLLTKLEQDALGIKIHVRRQDLQTDLNRKRELLDQINERLSDLAEMAAADSTRQSDAGGNDDGDSDTTDVDDILSEIITMTPSESLDSAKSVATEELDQERSITEDPVPLDVPAPVQPIPQQQEQPRKESRNEKAVLSEKIPEVDTSQTLRARPARGTYKSEEDHTFSEKRDEGRGHTTGSHLYGDSPSSPEQSKVTAISTAEAILDHQRAEQDMLSEAMLKLASELKLSSQALSSSLDEDKELVARAGDGMNKTGEGMDAVTRRMGTLQRMTEGEGYWGRLKLYAMVYGLMVILILVVFVLPKLRF
ncbi:hypothetical protein V8F20_005890 [Naviculisporaceae sp. PSN 640]